MQLTTEEKYGSVSKKIFVEVSHSRCVDLII
jgi:hypothetical protein